MQSVFLKNFINWHECQLDDIGYLVLAYSVLEVSKMDCMLYVVFGRNKALMPYNIESTISLVPIQMEVH